METTEPPETEAAEPPRPDTVDVRFRIAGRARSFDAGTLALEPHDLVVVETERGPELGEVIATARDRWPEEEGIRLPRVLRRADARDLNRAEHNRGQEREAHRVFAERAHRLGLDVKLIRADFRFDGGKAVFYFMSEARIDFRGLVRDLSQALHTRVEMRQVGARDETKLVGGVGPCGRELCCSSWLREFQAVSVKMAKEQGLSLNPSKLAGMCGRLKCCLRYEYDTYLALRRGLPKVGTRVQSVKGDGTVVKHLVLKQRVLLQREEDGVTVECSLEDLVERRPDAAPEG
ncbi:MAG TPA: regulatory iron-sulfur-containing complex subunit RicT [Candidatus Binatia bacterium]|nr:regulatory iron-sulfur-containing complex subunit RicT [Candidatus Binatia bacterium]